MFAIESYDVKESCRQHKRNMRTQRKEKLTMKHGHRQNTPERKHFVMPKSGNLHLKPRLLYTGRLLPSDRWYEEAHAHEFLEVMLVRGGAGIVEAAGKEYRVRAGDLIVYNPHVQHCERADEGDPLATVFFGVNNIRLEGLSENCLFGEDRSVVIPTDRERKFFESLFSALLEESEQRNAYSEAVSECCVSAILLKILRILAYGNEEYLKINRSYLEVKKYIDENYRNLSGIDQVCKDLYISKYYLAHLFKEYSGKTPLGYVIEKRLEYAEQLLVQTNLPVSEIAAQCGYTETGSFLKTFKNIEGVTPSEYRNGLRGERNE